MTESRKLLIALLVPIEVVAAVLAWRDMADRPESRLRGTKRFWRIFVLLNPGNSLLYWLIARR